MKKEKWEMEKTECIVYSSMRTEVCKETSGRRQFLLVQPVDENELKGLDGQMDWMAAGMEAQKNVDVFFLAFRIKDWNRELSPWKAAPVFGKGKQGFGDGAAQTLKRILQLLVPEMIRRYSLPEEIPVILGGYSLAGLFSLWSACQTDRFCAVACASPSVWFPGWMEYAGQHVPKAECVYLSLGDREEKTKNKIMAAVGDCIRSQYELLGKEKAVLEWNEGNHFKDPDKRTAKAFVWCMKKLNSSIFEPPCT